MKRVLFSLLCLLVVVLGVSNASAQRLFVLVAADTTDEHLRDGVQQSMKWVRDCFYANVPKDRLLVRFLQGEQLTKDALAASVAGCPVQPDDALVVWWAGRGEFEDGRRMLVMPDGTKLASADLRDQMIAKSPRLRVLVIDAVSRTVPVAELPEKTMDMAPAVALSPVFRSLFFVPIGSVEIDSASPDQRPLLLGRIGGLLTTGLGLPPGALGDVDNEAGAVTVNAPSGERELILERGLLWRDLNESVEWDTVLAELRSMTSANYRRAVGSKQNGTGQTPAFGETRLKYPDHFVEWHAAFGEFRSRPRETRIQAGNDDGMPPSEPADEIVGPDATATDPSRPGPTGDVDGNSPSDESVFQINPGDHLVEVDGKPIHHAKEFEAAMQAVKSKSGEVPFVLIDNMNGQRIHCTTQINSQTDRDFGIEPWYWKESHVIVNKIRPDSPAARAKMTRVVDSTLPEEVGLGIRGALVRINDPLRDGEKVVGVKVAKVIDPKRSNLKPGDVVLAIDNCNFANAEGYRYALRHARQVASIWYVDGRTGRLEHGHVSLPHTPPENDAEPPEGAMTVSITPEGDDSCPIW